MPNNRAREKQRLTIPMRLKALDEAGTFSGYLAVFNNVDLGGDKIAPGAFTKTLQELRSKQERQGSRYILPIFFGHDPTDPIGGFTLAREDAFGLYVEGELDLDIPQGQRAYSGMKRGYLNGMSIGYQTMKQGWEGNVRILRELALLEGSVTPIPMNPDALVQQVKNHTQKGAARMPQFARRRSAASRKKATPDPRVKAVDFSTTFTGMQQEDSLQEEWADCVQALISSLYNAMWEARWAGSMGSAGGDDVDHAALGDTILQQFHDQMSDLLGRSFSANFAPDLDDDGDSFQDPDESSMSMNGSMLDGDYMARQPGEAKGERKAGRVLSQANRARMLKSLNMIADGHKDLMALHGETEPGPADDPATGDDQPGGKSGGATQDPAQGSAQVGEVKGSEPGGETETTPLNAQAIGEMIRAEIARQRGARPPAA
jgi:HK97 family phage prohead protease